LQYEIKEVITSGQLGSINYVLDYVRQHESADRLLYYLSMIERYSTKLEFELYGKPLSLFQGVAIDEATPFWTGEKEFTVIGYSEIVGGRQYVCRAYNADTYIYPTNRTYPGDGSDIFLPDLTRTPPTIPLSLDVTDEIVAGSTISISLVAEPPVTNYVKMTFAIRNDDNYALQFLSGNLITSENLNLFSASDFPGLYNEFVYLYGDTKYFAIFTGLSPETSYTLLTWATNLYDLDGAVLDESLTTIALP
jgi:hypothetical protein